MCEARDVAWDCATGNGQAARALCEFFERVIASDASEEQLAAAQATAQIDYRIALAESSGLTSASIDLITVAQALHWFDTRRFFEEARRVLKPGGVLAYWCYDHCIVAGDSQAVVKEILAAVEDYWPPERRIVAARYTSIPMPFAPIDAGRYSMKVRWNAAQMLGYMRSWSASQRFRQDKGQDATERFAADLHSARGAGRRTVSWPITLYAGRR